MLALTFSFTVVSRLSMTVSRTQGLEGVVSFESCELTVGINVSEVGHKEFHVIRMLSFHEGNDVTFLTQ